MHIVTLMDGQILKTRTVTRLTREDQFKLDEFRKFKVATHESGVLHKEDSYDQMLFKDLVREFLLQQRKQVTFELSESDTRVIHSPDFLFRILQLRERLQFLQPRERVVQIKEYLILQDYLSLLNIKLEEESPASKPPSEFEINMITSLKQGILEISEYSVNSDQSEEDQELQLLQDLKLQEWYQGDLQGYSEKEVKEAIKKELISLSSVGHEVYDPVPLNLLSSEDQARSSSQGGSLDPGQVNSRRDLWEKDTLKSLTKSQSMLTLLRPRHSRLYFS